MSFWRDNGLSIVLLAATLAMLGGMGLSGWLVYQEEFTRHPATGLAFQQVFTAHFFSALFENWESEFLQMAAYVMLTAFLFQRGSSESKSPDDEAGVDRDPLLDRGKPGTPLPVRGPALIRIVYSYSLGIALSLLFVTTFLLHLKFSTDAMNQDALMHGESPTTIGEHLANADFWFESMQNWQSEFLSTAVLVILSIFLRFRGSPESKPVSAPHSQTGE